MGWLGMGFTFAVANETVLATVPRQRAGAAAAISETTYETTYEIGGALGIALLGSLMNARYRDALHLPAGLPGDAARVARESIGDAVHVATTLPADRAAARQAFVDAGHASLLLSAGLLCVFAVVSLVALRGVPTVIPDGDEAGSAPEGDGAPPAPAGDTAAVARR